MKKENINSFLENLKIKDKSILVYDINKLKSNIESTLFLRDKYNIKFLFPIKSFPNNNIIKVFNSYGFGFDIANEEEYKLIDNYITDKTIISINGINDNFVLDDKKNNVLNNLNSFNNKINNYNAVRINTYLKNKLSFSRFGINYGELYKLNKSKIKSISIHFYDDNKNEKIKYLFPLIIKCIQFFPNLEYFDFGGTWDILNLQQMEKMIKSLRKIIPSNICIVFEVGENWFKNVGYLVAKVYDINYISNKKIISINAVKDCVAKWSILKPINIKKTKNKKIVNIIFGNSCYEKDVFCVLSDDYDFKLGDKIIFEGLNGYSYAWITEFNGSLLPEVIFYE